MKQVFILLFFIILLNYTNEASKKEQCNLKIPKIKESECFDIYEEGNDKDKCCYEEYRLNKINGKMSCKWIEDYKNKKNIKNEKRYLKDWGAQAIEINCSSNFYVINNLLFIIILFLSFNIL
jgi:hypothetical protein